MAGPSLKKRSREDGGRNPGPRPSKRHKKRREYHSSDSEDVEHDAPPNLLGSDDEDIQDAVVDDGAPSSPQSASGSSSDSGSAKSARIAKLTRPKARRREKTTDTHELGRDSSAEDEEDDEDDGNDSLDLSGDDSDANGERPSHKSKRNDETAFATSIAKILSSSKLPRSKRADPIVARSAMSQAAGQQAADAALEAKARRRLRQEKRLALEKGRVRDVLVASTTRTLNMQTGAVEETLDEGAETTADIMETERRLRKVAQRGVVKLFNAVRASQVKAAEATKEAKRGGRVSSNQKQEMVTQMSKKGFLDLIASGGEGLRKGAIEEA